MGAHGGRVAGGVGPGERAVGRGEARGRVDERGCGVSERVEVSFE